MLSLKGHVPHTDIPGWDPRAPQMTGRGEMERSSLDGPTHQIWDQSDASNIIIRGPQV